MKKTFYLFASAALMLLTLNSCKKKTDGDVTLPFSTLSVQEQKQAIEQNGIDLMDKVDALQSTPAIVALTALNNNINGGMPALVKPLAQLRAGLLKNDTKAVETFGQQMKVAAALGDSLWGTYTWNPEIHDFDHQAGASNSATILIPATEGSSDNTGEIKITYEPSTIVAPGTDPVEYMPKSLSVVMKVSGATVMTFTFSGAYKSDATPTSLTQTLVVDKFNWNVTFTNNDKDVSAKYSFTYDQKVLLKMEIGAAGSLTATNIQENMENDPEKVLSSGAVLVQVMNIAMKGTINDFKGFAAESKALKPDSVVHPATTYNESWTEYVYPKAYYDKMANIINKYINIYGFFANENKKFADVEFYSYEKTYTYEDWVWNADTQSYDIVKKTGTEYVCEPRFVLSDKSKVTIEDYLRTGFEDLITKIQGYMPQE
ncbi:MAG TPA: hypothetical protein VK152_10515 [Paludibacter sp.]|nr:hypothetical protein [Paludibacter sp.]